ncbi:lysine exporter LysO family protein [Acidianus sp.]|uniref:lysine exporter LysO family protein n=2 Tax=Acidianus sp. TaxID=1872104 RepID=UPI00397E3EEC
MFFTLTFISLYVVSLILGRKINIPQIFSDGIVLILIFTISFWGGNQISAEYVGSIILVSFISSLVIVTITYFLGSFINERTEEGKIKGVDIKTQLKYLLPLIIGFLVGLITRFYSIIISDSVFDEVIDWELYVLAVVIGISIGKELKKELMKRISRFAIFSVIIAIIGGIISSVILFLFLSIRPFNLALAISLGSGWYSYTGPIVAKYYGPIYGVIAFLVNFLREQFTFSLLPIFLRIRSTPLGAVAVGGATSMDTTLGFYVDVLGYEYGVGAMINGVVLTLIVPLILPIILSF